MAILERMYSGIAHMSGFVAAEIMRGIQLGHDPLHRVETAVRAGWMNVMNIETDLEKAQFESLSISLGLGEASSIALAANRDWVFASDDRPARIAAGSRDVKLTGTIGILAKAIIEKILTREKADEILALMIKRGFYAPVKSMKSLVD